MNQNAQVRRFDASGLCFAPGSVPPFPGAEMLYPGANFDCSAEKYRIPVLDKFN